MFLCADSTRFEKTGLGVFEAEDNLRVTGSPENLAKEKQNRKVENSTLDDKSLGPKDESRFQTLWECPQSEVRQNSSGCLHGGNALISRLRDRESKRDWNLTKSLCVGP